jgi:hypothetical protein
MTPESSFSPNLSARNVLGGSVGGASLTVVHHCDIDELFYARNGHGCMLQYAVLHLFGYDISLDDLKAFRVSP